MSTTSRTPKAQRREEARAAAEALRAEQARRARRQRVLVVTLLTLGLAVLVGLVVFILANQPERRDFSAEADPLATVTAPAGATASGGIPVGPSGVAGDVEGAAADAVVVQVYSDYMCPFCRLFEETGGPVLDDLRERGDVIVEYHPVSILDRASQGSAFSTRAATATALVADQAPQVFVDFVAVMFANQPAEQSTGLTDAEIAGVAEQVGAPEGVVSQIRDGSYLTGDGSFTPWVEATTEQASRDLPRLATPTVLLNGQEISELGVDWRTPGALEAAVERVRG